MKSPFLNQLRDAIHSKYYSLRTEKTCLYRVRYYLRYHQYQYPRKLYEYHIRDILSFLALQQNVAPSTQKTALNAIVFMYRHVIKREPGDFSEFHKPKVPNLA